MCCTRVELTGCGSVATAPASASSIAAIRSGENEAFEKSFIRCVRFAGRGVRVLIQPAGRPHVPNLRRIAEQIMRGDHYTASLGDANRCAAPSLGPSATRSIWLTPLKSGPGPRRLGITAHDRQRVAGNIGNSIAAVSKEIALRKATAPRPSSPVQIHPASLPAVAAVVTEVQLAASGS